MIKVIVGLGNPGAEYEMTRHNAGFWLVDALAHQSAVTLNMERRFHGLVGQAKIDGQAVWLVKPQTFMNRSGQSVAALTSFYRIAVEEILVVHDELDLSSGVARFKKGGGHGGHNGLKDIALHLGGPDFWRLRLGIGHPRDRVEAKNTQDVAAYVLAAPTRGEQEKIDDAMLRAQHTLGSFIKGDATSAMQRLHTLD
ncbi:MAG: aminoacyl-tRNA hydrolase [Ottowia sp.]|nr:aminoacyl-tRNA hydrolase [Ottowia sp.]